MTGEIYHWPTTALHGDLVRTGLGFLACAAVLLLVPPTSIVFIAFVVPTIVFAAYVMQTLLRTTTTLTLLPEGLAIQSYLGQRLIRWDTLDQFQLRYYTLRRDKETGWLDLKLGSPGSSITLDDRVEGFRPILERAWEAARARDIGISSSTYANLTAAGLLPKAPQAQ